MLFLRLSLGFGWCLEGSEPVPEEVEECEGQGSRKRKRLDVFKKREEKELDSAVPEAAQDSKKKDLVNDGIGEVGRLCIWCVKM